MDSFHCNWNNLPNEMKLNIIHRLDRNSRLSLRTCSTSDYQLVDSIPYRTIHKLLIWNAYDEEWCIDITRNIYGSTTSYFFESFQDFQNKLQEVIESCECINLLLAVQNETPLELELNLTKDGKLLKVQELIFSAYNRDAPDILAQIDPSHLKKLHLCENCQHDGILETPQALQAQYLRVYGYSVTVDELLAFENPELSLEYTTSIEIADVNLYLKKWVLNSEKPIDFRCEIDKYSNGFGYAELEGGYFDGLLDGLVYHQLVSDTQEASNERREYILTSTSEKYQLLVKHNHSQLEAKTISRNQAIERYQNPDSLKSADYVEVSPKRLTITEKRTAPVHFLFNSTSEMGDKVTELLNNLDYIKYLKLEDMLDNLLLNPPNKQITIGKLLVVRGNLTPNFLRQISPFHLKEIKVEGCSCESIYDMPQMVHAQKIDIKNCNIRDHQLLNMNAVQMLMNARNSDNLTDSGINMYIKKILTKLNLHDYNFNFCSSSSKTVRIPEDVLKDLNIFSKEIVDSGYTRYIVNSKFPKFKLELSECKRSISGKRITIDDV